MAVNSIVSSFPIYNDVDGNPLESGYLYIGDPGFNPEVAPKSVFWDAALTIPAVQPIRTIGGYPSRSGAPAVMYVDGDYSLTVRNKNSTLIYTTLNRTLEIDIDSYGNDISTISRGIYVENTSGVADTLTLSRPDTTVPDITAYYDGLTLIFDNALENTGAVTATLAGLTSKKVRNYNDTDLVAGDIKAYTPYVLVYNTSLDSGAGAFEFKNPNTYSKTETNALVRGMKNLIINGNKTIQQRTTTGGSRQVIDAENILISGSYTASFTGTATLRIYEATTLGATDATTTWSELTSGASASGVTVSVTAGRYVKLEFSTTDFSFVQFEQGSVATAYEQRNKQIEEALAYRYYWNIPAGYLRANGYGLATNSFSYTFSLPIVMRRLPDLDYKTASTTNCSAGAGAAVSNGVISITLTVTASGAFILVYSSAGMIADAEHFTDTYFEDRWF